MSIKIKSALLLVRSHSTVLWILSVIPTTVAEGSTAASVFCNFFCASSSSSTIKMFISGSFEFFNNVVSAALTVIPNQRQHNRKVFPVFHNLEASLFQYLVLRFDVLQPHPVAWRLYGAAL